MLGKEPISFVIILVVSDFDCLNWMSQETRIVVSYIMHLCRWSDHFYFSVKMFRKYVIYAIVPCIYDCLEIHQKISEHTFSGDPVTVAVNTTLLSVWLGWDATICSFANGRNDLLDIWELFLDIFVASTVSNKVSSEKMSGCSTFRGKLLRYLLSLLLLEPLVLRAADPEELQSSCSKIVILDLL